MWETAGEVKITSNMTFIYGLLHMEIPVLADQQELIYISSVQIQNVVWKTCQEWWMIGTDGERESESGKSVMMMMISAMGNVSSFIWNLNLGYHSISNDNNFCLTSASIFSILQVYFLKNSKDTKKTQTFFIFYNVSV